MRIWALVCVGLLGGLQAAPLPAQDRPADLTVAATGAAAAGEPMAMACALTLATVPSNTYVGRCRITVGGDALTLTGLPAEARRLVTVVLTGAVSLRGVAEEGTGRFAALVAHGAAGFPLDVQIDPLGRAWTIRGALPGGGSQVVAVGGLTTGSVTFAVQ